MNNEQVMHAMSIDDMYHVERVLARGKGGVTELVTVEGAGPFVRKKIPNELARRSVWSVLADCDCARLPQVEATYKTPDEFVVVYDFVPGDTLEALVKQAGPLDAAQAVSLALDICEAAGALHAQGVVHRDITPKNVVASSDGAHLIDLGIARLYAEGATRDTNALGTWGFAAPEQYGFKQTDARSDVYSIGCVLGYLLTGVMPDEDAYHDALADESAVPAHLRAVVERATNMEPSARYQSAMDLAAALRCERDAGGAQRQQVSLADIGSEIDLEELRAAIEVSEREVRGDKAERTSRRPKRNALLVVVACVLTVVAVILVLLAKDGIIARRVGVDTSSTPTWGGSYKPSTNASSAGAPSGDDEAAADGVLKVGNVSWRYCAGWVYATYSVTNTSSDKLLRSSTTTATARDASGNVVGSSGGIFSYVFPGQTLWDEVAVTDDADVATVTVTPETVEDWQQTSASADDASVFSVLNTTCKTKPGTALSVTGEVTCQKKSRFAEGQIGLAVLLKDASGSVVASQIVMTDYPADGGSSPFEAYILDVPEFDTYEVYPFDM